jgi:cell division cycle protein 20 (cofactor of APC complex)
MDTSPGKEEYKKLMAEHLFGQVSQRAPVLPLTNCARSLFAAAASSSAAAANNLLLAISPMSNARAISASRSQRQIPRTSVHVLDAPEMLEDYYLNLLDWSKQNTVGVALSKAVYLWQASTGE